MARPRSSYDTAKAIALISDGRTDPAAARELGTTAQAIRYLRQLGVFGRRRPGRPRKTHPLTIPTRAGWAGSA